MAFDPIQKFSSFSVADMVEVVNTLINEINERLANAGGGGTGTPGGATGDVQINAGGGNFGGIDSTGASASTFLRGDKVWGYALQPAAAGWATYPAPADIYAKFAATQAYLSPAGQTAVFATWLAAVSGTFTRAGAVGPAWDANGLLINYTANQPRFSYDPVTLVPNLLIEPASSNLVTYSQQPAASTGVWNFTSTGVTRTDANATGLDGTTSAGTIRETAANTGHYIWWRDGSITLTSGLFYAYQIFIKPIGITRMLVTPSTMGSNTPFYIDYTNVTVSDPAWSLELLSNGFYRLSKTFAANASAVPNIIFQNLNASGALIYNGTPTFGWDLGGAQLEQVASISSPPSIYMQRPNATAVSRSADALAFTLPASASSLTYTFANGRQQVVSVSPGAYSVPTTLNSYQIASFIDVDLTQIAAPVLSVAGRAGNVTLQQSDIAGLKTTDIGRFSSLSASLPLQTFGPAMFQNDLAMFRWTSNSNAQLSAVNRYVLIGYNAGNALLPASQSNAVVIGTSAAATSTSVATSTIIGDTAGASSPTIGNSELIGNEAGSGPTIATSTIIGNLARVGGVGATVTQAIVMGQGGMFANGAVDTVAIGFSVGKGTTGSVGSINRSVLIGSQAGMSVGAAATTMTNLFLIGYNVQPPTATTSNYLNFGDFLKADLSTAKFALTKQDASPAELTVGTLVLTNLPTSDPGVPGAVWNDAGALKISP